MKPTFERGIGDRALCGLTSVAAGPSSGELHGEREASDEQFRIERKHHGWKLVTIDWQRNRDGAMWLGAYGSSRRGLQFLLLGLIALVAGCAAPKKTMSFAEAGFYEAVEPEGQPEPPVKTVAPRRVATQRPSGPPIDGILLRFSAQARARRSHPPSASGFPLGAILSWQELAAELDVYLKRPLPQTPLLELIRAGVTIEAELETDARRFGRPPEELQRLILDRRTRLANRIAAARALGQRLEARRAPAVLQWPVEDAGISSLFGMRLHPLDGTRKMHYGVDLATARGRAVLAAASGFVVQAGWSQGYGLMVELRHSGDLSTRYSHLSRILCYPGDEVEPGQLLGLVGATGKATGPHLHFEVWRGGKAADPLGFLGSAALASHTAGAAGN